MGSILELMTLVIYDISDDELRIQVAKYLKSKGLKRVQKSAFAGPLTSAQRSDLIAGLKLLIRGKEANIQIYPLTPASFNQRIVLGIEMKYEEDEHLI
ncbi:MAG: CRISPR-associated endonuclease Cas2 [Candidatus Methanomethyliaceae archaeon]|nr:CRISPR-associated endonuclease Cas2 [Candidatus Methanomethyliaceae archaeon]